MCRCLCSTVIVLINIVFMVISLALAAVGGLLLFGTDQILTWTKDLIAGVLSSLPNQIDTKNLIEEIMKLISTVPKVIFGIGVTMFAIVIIAYMVACCKYKILTYIYLIIVGVVLIGQIALYIIIYTKQDVIGDPMKNELEKMIINDYEGFNTTQIQSFLLNIFHITLNCCGANNGSDFLKAKKWNRNMSTSTTYNNVVINITVVLQYPLTCCKMQNFQPVNVTECIQGNKEFVHTNGCVDSLLNTVNQYIKSAPAYAVIGGIFGIQALLVIACIVLLKCDGKVDPT